MNSGQNISTPIVIVFAAFLAAVAYIVGNVTPMFLDTHPENNFYEFFVGIITIVFAIGFTVFVQRKLHAVLGFGRLFVTGWVTALVMSLFISAFYLISFSKNWIPLDEEARTVNIISTVVIKYNALGMMISALLALIFKTE